LRPRTSPNAVRAAAAGDQREGWGAIGYPKYSRVECKSPAYALRASARQARVLRGPHSRVALG
jgi:hypothetical protein